LDQWRVFILNSDVFNYLPDDSDETMWEDGPLEQLAANGELYAYKHNGFWKCMDALRDKIELEEMWDSGKPKWKCW
jgi:glucose-1-phosphate cytidylyltransferase